MVVVDGLVRVTGVVDYTIDPMDARVSVTVSKLEINKGFEIAARGELGIAAFLHPPGLHDSGGRGEYEGTIADL